MHLRPFMNTEGKEQDTQTNQKPQTSLLVPSYRERRKITHLRKLVTAAGEEPAEGFSRGPFARLGTPPPDFDLQTPEVRSRRKGVREVEQVGR